MTDTRLTDSQRVVVTGLGATTPLGGDVASTWSAMLAGKSGVKVLTQDWVDMLPVHIAASVAVDPSEVLPVPQIKRNDRSAQFALIAAREAWADAGSPEIDPERIGVVIASGIGGVTTLLAAYDILKEKGARRVLPMTVPMLMPNGPAALVGLELVARAGVHTPVSACSSGAEAIAYAADMIRTGRADIVAAGGTEAAIHPLPLAGFAAMQALSTRNDEPERASRPYDKGRDGFVLGEGAGVLVLESLAHAKARGATIYAEIAGSGITSDAHHIAQPDPVGAGANRLRSARMVAMVSTAPAAPSRCPVIDLVADTHSPSTASPSALRIASASATSPTGVEVAWALMWTTSEGTAPADSMAIRIARLAPDPTGSGWAMWWASEVMPEPAISA